MYVSAVLAAASYVDTAYLPGHHTVPPRATPPAEGERVAGRRAGLPTERIVPAVSDTTARQKETSR
jgi:hypothetical protein